MKNLVHLILASILLSCSSSKTVRTSKKTIKGDWVLSSLSYNKEHTLSVQLLNHASAACFEGSSWHFIPNNNSGTYTIENSECTTSIRHFIFTVQEINAENGFYDFLLKPTNRKGKSETNAGYRLELASLTESSMQWVQRVSVNGKPFPITMNFTKK